MGKRRTYHELYLHPFNVLAASNNVRSVPVVFSPVSWIVDKALNSTDTIGIYRQPDYKGRLGVALVKLPASLPGNDMPQRHDL